MADRQKNIWLNLKDVVTDSISRTTEFISSKEEYRISNGAGRMQEAAKWLLQNYGPPLYELQKIPFEENGMQGLFVQIRNAGDGVDYAWKSLAGQQRAACVKFLPEADGTLCFSVSEGKWLDKVVSGILSWAIFAPLIVVPAIGAWQQKKFLDEIERNLLVWFANWS